MPGLRIARHSLGLAATLAAALTVAALPAPEARQPAAPEALLAAARERIGGDAKVRALKSLRLAGTEWSSQFVAGGYTMDTEVPLEIRIAFPARYLKLSVFPSSQPSEIRQGFDGDAAISSLGGRVSAGADPTYYRRRATELIVGMLARLEPWMGVTPRAVDATRFELHGAGDYVLRVEIDPSTRLPVRVIYREQRQVRTPNTIRRRGEPRPATPQAGRGGMGAASAADLPTVDMIVSFHDRRDVGGYLLPHRILTTASGVDLWEMRFRDVTIDPVFTDADFRATGAPAPASLDPQRDRR